jgi:hypothetical protein
MHAHTCASDSAAKGWLSCDATMQCHYCNNNTYWLHGMNTKTCTQRCARQHTAQQLSYTLRQHIPVGKHRAAQGATRARSCWLLSCAVRPQTHVRGMPTLHACTHVTQMSSPRVSYVHERAENQKINLAENLCCPSPCMSLSCAEDAQQPSYSTCVYRSYIWKCTAASTEC